MNLIGIDMVDTLMILMIEQYSTNVEIGLLHAMFEGLDFIWIFYIYYMFVRILTR